MKKVIYLSTFLVMGLCGQSQNLANFFYNPGCRDIAYMAHPSNTIDHLTYDVEDGYVVVDVIYKDDIETKISLERGFGSLYFTSIHKLYDNDIIDPFVAFGLGSAFLVQLEKNVDPEKYNKVRKSLINNLGIDPENWNGYDWALFAINLDYISNYSQNN